MAALSQDYAKELQLLQARLRLQKCEETHLPDDFGDACLILAGKLLSLRIIRDRGEVHLDVRFREGDWSSIDEVLESMQLHPHPGVTLGLEDAVAILSNEPRFVESN